MYHHDPYSSLGMHASLTHRLYLLAMEKALKGTGISPIQFRALSQLIAFGPVSQVHLAHALSITQASATRLIDRMERDGWIERRPDPEDSRAKIIEPTTKAVSTWDNIGHIGHKVKDLSHADIAQQDVDKAIEVLTKVRENLIKKFSV